MTILCVRGHAEPGAHRVTCPDHPGWTENPGRCHGCLPRAAERGFLCAACYERTVDAVAGWHDFARHVRAAEGRLVSPEPGSGTSAPRGYSNLTLSFLALDECERLLASRDGRTVDLWVHDEDGARDAIRFAIAAEQAYRSLEVEEREQELVRERCHECGSVSPAKTHEERGVTVVTCAFCLTERARIRPDITRWRGSATCADRLHADCDNVDCPCACHLLGTQSRPGGVQALWDADQHTVTSQRPEPYRADWIVQDALTIHHTTERTAA
ncbi:hypothetical protein G3H63_09255 [Microbacterium resistens]|uniref:hypothetical protein n=1 Tax=Microbacterium resistens TaxID=156977 RepID=UPI001C55B1F4|nr:hypothetical protein [Microbacterium resistens]MBW1639257.1 hypothetical protein [Microbacterium resistens]